MFEFENMRSEILFGCMPLEIKCDVFIFVFVEVHYLNICV